MFALAVSQLTQCTNYVSTGTTSIAADEKDDVITGEARKMLIEGKKSFRYNTFGNETFWSRVLQLQHVVAHKEIASGTPGMSPAQALALGLKFDLELIPANIASMLHPGNSNLQDPGLFFKLLQMDAVVGVKARFDRKREIIDLGLACAACHSTVDNTFAPGIGMRLDGRPNRDLDLGMLIAMSPSLSEFATKFHLDSNTLKHRLQNWGPGSFDPNIMGNIFTGLQNKLIPSLYSDHSTTPTAITWFSAQFKQDGADKELAWIDAHHLASAKNVTAGLKTEENKYASTMHALMFYRMAIPAPAAPEDSYNPAAAKLGAALFNGKAKCSSCHTGPSYSDGREHAATEFGMQNYSAVPRNLKGLWSRSKGGFYHDGRLHTYNALVEHYNRNLNLSLSNAEKYRLVEFLKSI